METFSSYAKFDFIILLVSAIALHYNHVKVVAMLNLIGDKYIYHMK